MGFILNEHYRNRERLSEQALKPYHGKEVAWNLEGTQIVASGDDFDQVFQAVVQAGLDPEQVVFSYVERPGEIMLGGALFRTETGE